MLDLLRILHVCFKFFAELTAKYLTPNLIFSLVRGFERNFA
jgi:hypothetical protein